MAEVQVFCSGRDTEGSLICNDLSFRQLCDYVLTENVAVLQNAMEKDKALNIRKNCFISSHVVISGFCEIGENCFFDVDSGVGNNTIIGKDCTIAAGVAVTGNLPDNAAVQPSPTVIRENVSRRLWKTRE